MEFVSFEQAVEIWDTLRKPVNAKERQSRIEGKDIGELYPYYGATGQVGYIDGYISDGEYVLLGEDGAPFLQPTATKAYLIHGKAWVNNHAHVLRSKYNNAFLCYYLNSFDYQGFVSGTTRLKLTQAAMKQIPIPAPPLSEQKHIVSRIEELFSQLDASVAELKTAKERLKVYRQAVLKEAFAKYHTFTPLKQVSERIFDGPFGSNLKTADYVEQGIRVVRLENLKNAWFDDTKRSFITKEKYQTISSHTVYPDDLIMSTFMSENIKICQLPKKVGFAVNKADCIGIRLKSDINPHFIMYYLASREAYNALMHQVHGATRPRVNAKQIKAMQIPIAGLLEQNDTVTAIEGKMSICDSIEKTVNTALQQAEALRQSILKKAFEGEF